MNSDELRSRRSMMELDPPDHTRLRRLVQPGFTPKVTATYEAAFRKLFNITRQPNPHVTFGTGRHKCLGASLAELEVRVFFEEFLDRVARFEGGEPDRLRSNFIRGIKHLPVKVG